MDLGLSGKTALVTGASRGLGYATALLLAQEGARVAINGRDAQRLEKARQKIAEESGAEVVAVAGDVGQADVPAQVVDQTLSRLGGLDILVTNTGGPTPGPFEAMGDAEWLRAIDLVPDGARPPDQGFPPGAAQIECGLRTDDHLDLGEAAHTQPGLIEQCPRSDRRIDQKSGPGAWSRRHPLQFYSAGLD